MTKPVTVVADEDEEEPVEPPTQKQLDGPYGALSRKELITALEERDKKIANDLKRHKKEMKEQSDAMAAALEEVEAKAKAKATLSPAEMKAQQQAMQRSAQEAEEQSDLELAMDLMGGGPVDVKKSGGDGGGGGGAVGGGDMEDVVLFEAMDPETREEFEKMSFAITSKALKYKDSPFWKDFTINTSKELCSDMKPDVIGKVASALQILKTEKNKAMMGKKKKKAAGKAQLGGRGGGNKGFGGVDKTNYGNGGGGYDEFDDFM